MIYFLIINNYSEIEIVEMVSIMKVLLKAANLCDKGTYLLWEVR